MAADVKLNIWPCWGRIRGEGLAGSSPRLFPPCSGPPTPGPHLPALNSAGPCSQVHPLLGQAQTPPPRSGHSSRAETAFQVFSGDGVRGGGNQPWRVVSKKEGHLEGAKLKAWPQAPDLPCPLCFTIFKLQGGLDGMAGPLTPGGVWEWWRAQAWPPSGPGRIQRLLQVE